jgi:hypothetical protein
MNARPIIRERLLEMKIRKWHRIATRPLLAPKCSPAKARRNFWRLAAKYPDVVRRLGFNELSVYDEQ